MKNTLRAALAALALSAFPAIAGTFADLHVVSRTTGERLPVHAHGGKLYVAGQPGERYSVQVANRSRGRLLAVVSVDGVNVVSGETAAPDQTGYVLSPWQSYDITGWRKNAGEVAAFYFTALPDSYAARTDRPAHVGVIGVAVFREWTPPRPRPQPMPRDDFGTAPKQPGESRRAEESAASSDAAAESRAPAGAATQAERPAAAPPLRSRERIGTGHGEREHSAVTFTDFRRATPGPVEVLTIHYDRHENLVARGIIPAGPRFAEPQPFPGVVRFVPDPRS